MCANLYQVKLATEDKIPFSATSGGHSFSINLYGIKNALRLTREGLIAVKVYNATSTMTVTGVPLHLVRSLNHCMLQA